MEVRFVIAVTRGFFFAFFTIAASPLNFRRKQQEKKKPSGTQGNRQPKLFGSSLDFDL